MSFIDQFDIDKGGDDNRKSNNDNVYNDSNNKESGEVDEQTFPYMKESAALKSDLNLQYVLPDMPREVVEVRAVAAIIDKENPDHYTIKNGRVEKIPLNEATRFVNIFNDAAANHKPIPLKYEHGGKRRIKRLSRTAKGELVKMDDTKKFLGLKQAAAGGNHNKITCKKNSRNQKNLTKIKNNKSKKTSRKFPGQIEAEILTKFPGLGFVKKAALEELELKDGKKLMALVAYAVINNEDYMQLAKMLTISRHYADGTPYVSKGIKLPLQYEHAPTNEDGSPYPATTVITPDIVYRRIGAEISIGHDDFADKGFDPEELSIVVAGDRELTIVLDYHCITTDDPTYFYYYTGTQRKEGDRDAFIYKLMDKSPYEHNEATSKVKSDYVKLGKSIAFFHYAFRSINRDNKEEENNSDDNIPISESTKTEEDSEEKYKEIIKDNLPDIKKPLFPYPLNPSLFERMSVKRNCDNIDIEDSADSIVKLDKNIKCDGGTLLKSEINQKQQQQQQQQQQQEQGRCNQVAPNIYIITQPTTLPASDNTIGIDKSKESERGKFHTVRKMTNSKDKDNQHLLGVNDPPVIEFSGNSSVQAPTFYQTTVSAPDHNINEFCYTRSPQFNQIEVEQQYSRNTPKYQHTNIRDMQDKQQLPPQQQQPIFMTMSSGFDSKRNALPNMNTNGHYQNDEVVMVDRRYHEPPPQ